MVRKEKALNRHKSSKTLRSKATCMSGKNHQYWFSPVAAASATRTPRTASVPKDSEVPSTQRKSSTSGSSNPEMSSGQWSCPGCPSHFDDSTALNLHCAQTHPNLETQYHRFCVTCQQFVPKGPIHFTTSPKHPKCSGCHVGFEDKAQLREHLRLENACETCMVHHGSADGLESHYLRLIRHRPQTRRGEVLSVDDPPGAVNAGSAGPSSATPAAPQPMHLFSASSILLPPSRSSSSTYQHDSKEEGLSSPTPADRTAMARKMLDDLVDESTSSYTAGGSSTFVDGGSHKDRYDLDDAASMVSYGNYSNTTPDEMSSVGRRSMSPRSVITSHTAAWSSGHSEISIVSQDLGRLSRRDNEDSAQSIQRNRDLTRSPGNFVQNTDNPGWTRRASKRPGIPSVSGHSESSDSSHSTELTTPSEERIRSYLQSTVQPTPSRSSRGTSEAQGHEWDTSWSCRSCQRAPCIEPVATFCGHIFCRSCILLELGEHGVCPVCKKMFLLRLDVANHPP
ncbi:hypothetical protein C8Q70DRAFT_140315 [Cubamyces menziesii]|nr:hypothetical protein C8Q70DRAFT_140315 [Cubamyces menziesii]